MRFHRSAAVHHQPLRTQKAVKMKLPTVDRFFFCMPLDIGAFVLAGLSISCSVSIVTLATVLLIRYAGFFATLNETDQNFFRPVLISKYPTTVCQKANSWSFLDFFAKLKSHDESN